MDTIQELEKLAEEVYKQLAGTHYISLPSTHDKGRAAILAALQAAVDAGREREAGLRVKLFDDSATHLWLFQQTLEHLKNVASFLELDDKECFAAVIWAEQSPTEFYQAAAIREGDE